MKIIKRLGTQWIVNYFLLNQTTEIGWQKTQNSLLSSTNAFSFEQQVKVALEKCLHNNCINKVVQIRNIIAILLDPPLNMRHHM